VTLRNNRYPGKVLKHPKYTNNRELHIGWGWGKADRGGFQSKKDPVNSQRCLEAEKGPADAARGS
jgi:hypothetical protein